MHLGCLDMARDRDSDDGKEVPAIPYDEQSPAAQAETRRQWEKAIERTRSALNFEKRFIDAGESFSTADADGNVVVHEARQLDPD